jgi:hypothetical protein
MTVTGWNDIGVIDGEAAAIFCQVIMSDEQQAKDSPALTLQL